MTSCPLTVYYHPYVFFTGRFGGIARYICELVDRLQGQGIDARIPVESTINEYLLHSPWLSVLTQGITPIPPMRKLIRNLQFRKSVRRRMKFEDQQWQALEYLKRHRFDLIHPSDTSCPEILPNIGKTPLVVTVHDMTHELFPQFFGIHPRYAQDKKAFVDRADRIIAISQTTKTHLVDILGVPEEKIDVIYHGNSLLPPANVDELMPDLPERYIMFVGSRWAYKNFDNMLKAFSLLRQEDKDLILICTGGGKVTRSERRLLQERKLEECTRFLNPSDDELAAIYKRCLCFVYPSYNEGFGLPLLEAFACSAPVACSRASCFPEIAGEAALYFDPNSAEDMAATILRCIRSEDLRRGLISAGAERLKLFSWDRCARQTLDTYHKALGK